MNDEEATLSSILSSYTSVIFNDDLDNISQGKTALSLPHYRDLQLIRLCQQVKDIFINEDIVLELQGPITVVGDIHGHLLDLLRILKIYGLPDKRKYLFLGDVVDRGEFSIEVVTLIFALKIKYPSQVYIIRGNHEFAFMCMRCGFKSELDNIYHSSLLFDELTDVFTYMPLVALINKKIICVHGGLGPSWFSVAQAKRIQRPIIDFGDDIIDAMTWSDPSETIDMFEPSTNRGTGYLFGKVALTDFLDSNELTMMIRAHECVSNGCQFFFNDRLATVFCASNYCGLVGNKSAVITINKCGTLDTRTFPPFPYLRREFVSFINNSTGVSIMPKVKASQSSATMGRLFTPMKLPRLGGGSPRVSANSLSADAMKKSMKRKSIATKESAKRSSILVDSQ